MGPQEAVCRFTSGFTFAHFDYFRFLSIIIFAFPLDYRISCFRLRFISFGLLDSYVFDLDFYIFDFEFKIFDFEFKIFDFGCKNSGLRLKYYCSYFCPQRNAIVWDKHAPVKRRKVGAKGLPWLTTDLISSIEKIKELTQLKPGLTTR